MRRTKTYSLKEALQLYIEALKMQSKLQDSSVVNAWESVVGEVLAKMTEKIFMKDKKLFVRMYSSIAKNELILHKQQIINKLNAKAKADVVKDIIFM